MEEKNTSLESRKGTWYTSSPGSVTGWLRNKRSHLAGYKYQAKGSLKNTLDRRLISQNCKPFATLLLLCILVYPSFVILSYISSCYMYSFFVLLPLSVDSPKEKCFIILIIHTLLPHFSRCSNIYHYGFYINLS
ncbi:hypothetical protein HanPI659440_Chr13g0515631 [Helianthus annuus]|nr:hypothetical protein HanPI659440_Chr13g0515631 [Helianthus annuus]